MLIVNNIRLKLLDSHYGHWKYQYGLEVDDIVCNPIHRVKQVKIEIATRCFKILTIIKSLASLKVKYSHLLI